MKKWLACGLIFVSCTAIATETLVTPTVPSPSQSNLLNETFLHPMDSFTADTLRKGEFVYNQSPFTLPLPSWAWWGITDWLTAEIDALPLLGGFFQEPYLPVPSFNFRFRLLKTPRLRLAYESMFQYLYVTQEQANSEHLVVERRGASWYNRLNVSIPLASRVTAHISGGATYSHDLEIRNKSRASAKGQRFMGQFHPDFSLGFEYRARDWWTAHLTGSYGTTFVYLDNVPRKYQLTYGFRVAPFLSKQSAIWRNLRLELTALVMYFPDAEESMELWLPIWPYFYWSW